MRHSFFSVPARKKRPKAGRPGTQAFFRGRVRVAKVCNFNSRIPVDCEEG